MKNSLFALLVLAGSALALPAMAQPADPVDAVRNMIDPSPEAKPAPGAAPAAAPAAQKAEKKSYSNWWRNRQIERGPGSLRPGHHRRLFRRTVPQ